MPRVLSQKTVEMATVAIAHLCDLVRAFDLPPTYKSVVDFYSKSYADLSTDPLMKKEWEKVKLKPMQLITVTQTMIMVLWAVLSLGKVINALRQSEGLYDINWIQSATDFDKRKRIDAKKTDNG